jgi:hypothetical protein
VAAQETGKPSLAILRFESYAVSFRGALLRVPGVYTPRLVVMDSGLATKRWRPGMTEPHLDLACPFTRDFKFLGELFKFYRQIGETARHKDAPLAVCFAKMVSPAPRRPPMPPVQSWPA